MNALIALLRRYSKLLFIASALVLGAGISVKIYRFYTLGTVRPYAAPPSVKVDPSRFPEIITGKIISLKKLGYGDVADYHAMFSDDVRAGFKFWEKENYQYTQSYVHHLITRMESGEIMVYGIIDNTDQRLIGSVEARFLHEEDPGQIGTWLHEDYRGKGRVQEALYLLIRTYFEITKHDRINVYVEPFNKRSYKAHQKVGFKQAGRAQMGNRKFNILEMGPNDLHFNQ